MSRLATRLDCIAESATLKLNALVQQLKAEGQDVINLTAGEPDFFPPPEAGEAVLKALKEGKSKYTPVAGIPALRQAIAQKTNAQQPKFGKWTAADVLVTNGGKHALYNAFMALLNEGDEVLIPSPFWLSYPEMVKLAQATPVLISNSFEEGFKVSAQKLKETLKAHPRAKMLILNSPSNPCGGMYSREELAAIGEVLSGFPNVWVISDEIYDQIVFGPTPFCSFLEAAPHLSDRVLTCNGMSKAYAMTGWRIGWMVGLKDVIQAMSKIQGQSTSGINSLAQEASVAALGLGESYFEKNVEIFRVRRDELLEILRKSSKLKVFTPEGAFYAFVGFGAFFQEGEDSIGFAERLLAQAKVAVVPGTPFGAPEFCRLSFATDNESLKEGCRRIVEFLQ